jgi:hypothetical protein
MKASMDASTAIHTNDANCRFAPAIEVGSQNRTIMVAEPSPFLPFHGIAP